MELIIFTGNIGSGKSLIASKLAKKDYVIVNSDAFTAAIQGGEYGLYDPKKKTIYHSLEFTAIRTALEAGLSVVIDRTCMKISDRKRYIDIGKEYNTEIVSYDWGPGDIDSLERRLKKPIGIPKEQWLKVHQQMANTYEAPSYDEGFDQLVAGPRLFTFYAFDFDGTIVENVFPAIGVVKSVTVIRMEKLWDDIRNILIIWTCRSGDYVNQMRAFLIKEKIPFDFINENPLVDYGSRKIYANEYYDDRNAAF